MSCLPLFGRLLSLFCCCQDVFILIYIWYMSDFPGQSFRNINVLCYYSFFNNSEILLISYIVLENCWRNSGEVQ